jgi:hypothetical protein
MVTCLDYNAGDYEIHCSGGFFETHACGMACRCGIAVAIEQAMAAKGGCGLPLGHTTLCCLAFTVHNGNVGEEFKE